MSVSTISNSGIRQTLTSQLQAEQTTLADLTQQLSSNQKHQDLTDYAPSDALNLMTLQNTVTQKQGYVSVINTVQARLSGYNTTMTDIEAVTAQAQTLANNNSTYSASAVAGIGSLATNFLKSVTADLNQQIGGRYIYAGSRYTTSPVTDLSTLSQPPSSTIYTDNQTLPIYDTGYSPASVTLGISGQNVTIGGSAGTGYQNASIAVNGKTYTYAVQATDTPSTIATSLAASIAADIPGTTATGSTISIAGSTPPTSAFANVTYTPAYATDQATIDNGYNVTYGVSSNNPAFQQVIAGLRYIQAAAATTDPTTYKSYMAQASTLLSTGTQSLQAVNTTVANNINRFTSEATTQKNTITSLSSQISSIEGIDTTQVSTELLQMQTQIQASYSATGIIEKLSIVSYL